MLDAYRIPQIHLSSRQHCSSDVTFNRHEPAVCAFDGKRVWASGGARRANHELFSRWICVDPLVGGPLSDRLGRRPVLLNSLAFFALSALACSVAPSFGALLFFRLLQGCAAGVFTTLPIAIVRDMFAGSLARQRASEIATINGIMPLIAPVFGSLVMPAGGWRVLFGSQAIFAGTVLLFLLRGFRESLPPAGRHRLQARTLISNYLNIFQNRVFLGYGLINGLTFACVFSFISSSPLLLMQRMGITHAVYPFLSAMIAIGGIVGSFVSSRLSAKRVSPRHMISTGLSLMLAYARIQLRKYLLAQPTPLKQPTIFLVATDAGFQQIQNYTLDSQRLLDALAHLPGVLPGTP